MTDPFEGLVNEAPADGHTTRLELLSDAKRGFAKLRKVFVQKPATSPTRASVLADMVRGRQERALDALLLLHALEPVLEGSPLPLAIWAKMLDSKKKPCTTHTASRAFDALVQRKLITRENKGRIVVVRPLLEDGSGDPWDRPGSDRTTVGKGYFTIPDEYWTTGLVDQLDLPGKAMFLIMLSETTQKPTFSMAVERAPQWYGISERTAERGYQQLRRQEAEPGQVLLMEHCQLVADPRSPTGLRPVWHRALADPYSMFARAQLQKSTAKAVRRATKKTGAPADIKTAAPKKKTRKKATEKSSGGHATA